MSPLGCLLKFSVVGSSSVCRPSFNHDVIFRDGIVSALPTGVISQVHEWFSSSTTSGSQKSLLTH